MADTQAARAELDAALNLVAPDGPEWIKISAAIAALDAAEQARIEQDFATATQTLDAATARLQALVASLQVNAASQLMGHLKNALAQITPVAQQAHDLLSGEPATALPGTPLENKVTFPAPEPSIPPVREFARDLAQPAPPATTGMAAVQSMIDDILRREGGYSDHPADKGGPTNFGITLRTLTRWRAPTPVGRDDVRKLTQPQAREIYVSDYYSGPHLDQLPAALQPVVFDMAVNHGPGTAVRLLQQVLCDKNFQCDVDGGIGPQTKTAAASAWAALGQGLLNALVDRREALYRDIVQRDASQQVFLAGWMKRAEEFRA